MALYEDIGNAPGQVYDFLKRKYVSLTKPDEDGDYSSRKGGISRQEKLAELLSQMGAQEQAVSTAGGITAPVSGMGALARGLTSFGGSFMAGKAAADAAALDKASRAEAAAAGKELYTMPGTKGQLRISDEDPGTTAAPMEMNMPTLPGQEPSGEKVQYTLNMPNIPGREMGGGARPYEDQQRMLDELDLSDNPYMANMATGARGRIEAERERAEAKALRDRPVYRANTEYGGSVVDPNTQEVISSVAPSPVKPSNKTPFAAVVNGKPGMFVYDDAGNPVAVPGMTPFRQGGGDGGEKAPSGYRSDGKGGLAFIPGGPADPGNKAKPPSQAFLRLEGDDLKDVQLAGSIASDLGSYANKIDTGKMTLGLAANLGSRAGLTLGMANQNAREIGSFRATLAKLRNDTLRLNKGTQTEGDAVRAFDELFQNINDQGFVRKRLDEINQINRRAQAQRITAINDRRELSGYDPIDESKYLIQPSAYESPAAQNTGGAGGHPPDIQAILDAQKKPKPANPAPR